jgi:hypothetical protein
LHQLGQEKKLIAALFCALQSKFTMPKKDENLIAPKTDKGIAEGPKKPKKRVTKHRSSIFFPSKLDARKKKAMIAIVAGGAAGDAAGAPGTGSEKKKRRRSELSLCSYLHNIIKKETFPGENGVNGSASEDYIHALHCLLMHINTAVSEKMRYLMLSHKTSTVTIDKVINAYKLILPKRQVLIPHVSVSNASTSGMDEKTQPLQTPNLSVQISKFVHKHVGIFRESVKQRKE